MYQIKLTKRAKREFKNITKLYKEAVIETVEGLKENPLMGKPLTRELTGKYSYRIGIYRVIYKISREDKTIIILTVGHRSIVYE